MKLTNRLASLLGISLAVMVLPFLVLTNVNLLMTPQFVYYEYGRSEFPPATRYDPTARTRFAVATVRYTRGELNDDDLNNLGVYSERELVHMRDVQHIAVPALAMNYVLGALLLVITVALARAGKWAVARRGLFKGASVSVTLLAAVGLFALVAFDSFFVAFHRVFFVGDSWLFAYTDSLIQFYPQPLWVEASIGIVFLTVLEAIMLAGITFPRAQRTEMLPA